MLPAPLPMPGRAFSSSPLVAKSRAKSRISRRQRKLAKVGALKIPKADNRVPLEIAWRALWAYSVASPERPFKVDVGTKAHSPHQLNVLRGRLTLPKDPRKTTEKFLILAHTDFPVGKEALKLRDEMPPGLITIVTPDLFRRVLSGEVSGYTKVLSDTHALPAVNKQLARFLGPKGLMPNLRRGTALEEPEQLKPAIAAAQGAMDWRTDKTGNVPVVLGRVDYTLDELRANLLASLLAIEQQVDASKIATEVVSGRALVTSFETNPSVRAAWLRKLNDKIKRVTLTVPGAPGFQLDVSGTFDPFTRSRQQEEYQVTIAAEKELKRKELEEAKKRVAKLQSAQASTEAKPSPQA